MVALRGQIAAGFVGSLREQTPVSFLFSSFVGFPVCVWDVRLDGANKIKIFVKSCVFGVGAIRLV